MNLAKLAAFLGRDYYTVHVYEGEDVLCTDGPGGATPVSEEALFYALLLRAAGLGLAPSVKYMTGKRVEEWRCDFGGNPGYSGTGPTPLDALVKAIEELP